MDATREQFLAHYKEISPEHWAMWVLNDLREFLCKQTDCSKMLKLDHPEKRFEIAEAISIMLKSTEGGMAFGLCDGAEGFAELLDPVTGKYAALAAIERHITKDTAFLLVNVISRDELTQRTDIPDAQA